MIDILQLIPKTAKKSPGGWWTFNCPCCVHMGETPDKRKRGGLKVETADWAYHCFNCNFKARFTYGQLLSKNATKLLTYLGVDEYTIKKINFDSIKNKKFTDVAKERERDHIITENYKFKTYTLPPGSRPITLKDTKFVNYLNSRGLNFAEHSFKITPNERGRMGNRIIIPYTYGGKIVGWTSRFLDKYKPKYKNEHQQVGYVHGIDKQKPVWQYAIVSEGILDAESIDGLAVLHNDITREQMMSLRRLDKEIIIVIDQDKSGLHLAELAINAGFSVSVPDWGRNDKGEIIHDINEAVQKYGKTATLLSIIHARESSKIKITVALNKMKRRMNIK